MGNSSKDIRRRLDDLRSASNLEEIGYLPPARCHALVGDRAGQFSADLAHPYRLIFEIANDPVPINEDNSIDRSQITAIRILAVEDTHG